MALRILSYRHCCMLTIFSLVKSCQCRTILCAMYTTRILSHGIYVTPLLRAHIIFSTIFGTPSEKGHFIRIREASLIGCSKRTAYDVPADKARIDLQDSSADTTASLYENSAERTLRSSFRSRILRRRDKETCTNDVCKQF